MALEQVGIEVVLEGANLFEKEAEKVEASQRELTGEIEQSTGANQTSSFSWTELSSAIQIGEQAFLAIKGAVDSILGPVVELAGQVRTLQQNFGATPEEASKLIQAADDMGVSFGSLEGAMNIAVRKGIEPTIENMANLADEYVSIQDPIARTKFLMDNFGRSGADLGPLMRLGADGIRELGNAAEESGLVMDQVMVDKMREYEIATDSLGDAWLSLKIIIATNAAPAISAAMDDITSRVDLFREIPEAIKAGELSWWDYVKVSAEVAWTSKTAAEALEELRAKDEEVTSATLSTREALNILEGGLEDTATATQNLEDQDRGLADFMTTQFDPAVVESGNKLRTELGAALRELSVQSIPDLIGSIDSYITKLSDATLENALHQAAVDKVMEAYAAGEISRLQAIAQLQAIKKEAEESQAPLGALADHIWGVDEPLRAAGGSAAYLRDRIDELHDKDITVTTRYVSTGEPLPPRQHGGLVVPDQTYLVGEAGPELFIPDRPGTIISNRDLISAGLISAQNAGPGEVVATETVVNVGPNYISNPMTQAVFESRLRYAIGVSS